MTVLEAAKLLEIPYTNAKGICRDFKYEQKVLTNSQMRRHHHKTNQLGFKLDRREFDWLRRGVLDKLEQFIADGTFSENVVKRIQKCSVDVILRLANAESYLNRFYDIVGGSLHLHEHEEVEAVMVQGGSPDAKPH